MLQYVIYLNFSEKCKLNMEIIKALLSLKEGVKEDVEYGLITILQNIGALR